MAKTALKIVLSLILLWLVFSKIDIVSFWQTVQKSNIFYLFLAFLAFHISKIISALRLAYYFRDLGIKLPHKTNLRLYYVGMFYNMFLPGGIGGDGYKVYLLRRHFNSGYKPLIQAHLLDRISGLVALLFLAALLLIKSSFVLLFPWLKPLAIFGVFAIFPLFIYLHKKLFRAFSSQIFLTTLLALFVQLFQLLSAFFIIKSLNTQLPVIDYLTLFLISSVVAVLPLTIGGVGAREFTFLYGLNLLGYDPTPGIAFSILFFTITLLASMSGALFLNHPLKGIKPLL